MGNEKKTDAEKARVKVERKAVKITDGEWQVLEAKNYTSSSSTFGYGVAFNVVLSPDDVKIREMIAQCLERVEAIRQKTQKDDKEIARLKAETRRIIAKLQAA